MYKLNRIIRTQSIKPEDIPYIIECYDKLIGGDESDNYKICKCPGSLRIMIDDLTLYTKRKGLKP